MILPNNGDAELYRAQSVVQNDTKRCVMFNFENSRLDMITLLFNPMSYRIRYYDSDGAPVGCVTCDGPLQEIIKTAKNGLSERRAKTFCIFDSDTSQEMAFGSADDSGRMTK